MTVLVLSKYVKMNIMKNNKYLIFSILMISIMFIGAGCNPFAKNKPEPATQPVAEDQVPDDTDYGDSQMAEDTALSNPATVYCLSRGGEFTMKKTLAGTTEGYCTLTDGQECEVWAMYKGECADIEEPEDEEEDESATSTEDTLKEDLNTTTSTTRVEEEDEDIELSEDDSTIKDTTPETTDDKSDEKKKIEGAIDIAVKPGEEPGEIIMSWDTHDLSAPDGYIVMLSGSDDVSYPTKYYHELNREESYSFTWVDLNTEKEYYFRVCIKSGDSCGTYSSIISTYPKTDDSE
jgi:putative hemolysin